MRFLREDEAVKTMYLFEGAPETRKISKSALKNWLVIFNFCKELYVLLDSLYIYISVC